MIGQAFQAPRDRYAIHGFSGWTRKRCEIYRIKAFPQPYAEEERARIAGVELKDYLNMMFLAEQNNEVLRLAA